MGIFDADLEFSDAQSLASKSSGVATKSTNVLDLTGGATMTDGWGNTITYDAFEGRKMKVNIQVNTALVGAGAAMLCQVMTKAANASISSGATELARCTIPATSVAGTKFSLGLPAGTTQRYLGILMTASGGKITSSKIDSWLSIDHETPSK